MADNINNIDENKVTPEVQESVSAEQAAVQDAKSYVMKEKDVESVSKKQIAMKILVQSGLYIFSNCYGFHSAVPVLLDAYVIRQND